MSTIINGIEVTPCTPKVVLTFSQLLLAPKFKKWFDKISSCERMNVKSIDIVDVDWFCQQPAPSDVDPSRLGFIKASVNGTDKVSGKPLNGICFVRGSAVAVLIRVNVTLLGTYILMCKQLRVPVGEECLEIPAGMVDSSDNLTGVAIKEISEETGLVVPKASSLKYLGSYYSSQGGLDEEVELFSWNTPTMSVTEFKMMEQQVYGADHENETIRLQFFREDEFLSKLPSFKDAKAEIAYFRDRRM
jgi:8-oxo-dGTP pyrophosphatase MutT (NUDIX family)